MRADRNPLDSDAPSASSIEPTSPRRRAVCIAVLAMLVTLAIPSVASAAPLDAADPGYVTNGSVYAVATSGSTTYIGGTFTEVGPATGTGAEVDRATSAFSPAAARVQGGVVNAVVADGSGGWFIGGTFTFVGGVARNRIAHINPDGSLDQTWNPSASSTVSALVRSGSTLYVGGSFTSISGVARNYLAAVSTTGLGGATDWNPNLNNAVLALRLVGTTMYAGGSFTTVNGGTVRNYAAALSTTVNAGTATAFNPNANAAVRTIEVNGALTYLGGDFTTLSGTGRNRIGAANSATGVLDPTFNPNSSGAVYALLFDGTSLLVGGTFATIGGQTRNNIAALSPTTGAATTWNPNASAIVRGLALDGTNLFTVGDFTTIGGQARDRAAIISTSTGLAGAWNPDLGGPAYAVAFDATTAYVGGTFTTMGAVTRNRIAAIDNGTGLVTSWDPNANTTVSALAMSGTTVYAGGSFATIGGQARTNLAALDTTLATNNATTWNPAPNGAVSALVVSGTTVYAGGAFTNIGGQARNRIGAVTTTLAIGNATTWNPNADAAVNALVLSGTTMYVGGAFTNIGGQARNRIAALDTTIATGNATTWNPNANAAINALAASGTTMYAGGAFTTIGGQTRANLAALDTTVATNNATGWNPNPNGAVNALAVDGSTVYAGGAFTTIALAARPYLAALDATGLTNVVLGWNPNPQALVRAVEVAPDGAVIAGGDFLSTGATSQSYIARWSTPVASTVAPTISGTFKVGDTLTCNTGTWTGSAPITLTRQWTRDGVDIGGQTGATYVITGADDGRLVRCVVTGSNRANSTTATSTSVQPVPAVPTNGSTPTISGDPNVGRLLACSTGSWTSSPTSFAYAWRRGGTLIGGETNPTYVVTPLDVAAAITCEVTATNAGGTSSAAASASVTGLPAIPTNTARPSITGTAQDGQVVTCTDGTWADTPTSWTRIWQRDGVTLPGETAATYALVPADAGRAITCLVTATNAGGSSVPAASAAIVPLPLPPTNAMLPGIIGTPAVGETISCTSGTWTSLPTSYSYAWTRDGTPIGGATSFTYLVDALDVGTSMRCEVVATNAGGSSSAATSAAVAGLPALPSSITLPAITGTFQDGSLVTCSDGTWSGSPTSFTRTWQRDGIDIAGETATTYLLAGADAGHAITCVVNATNASGTSAPAASVASIVLPLAPGNVTAPALGGPVQSGRIATCSDGTWSRTPTSYTYAWELDAAPIVGETARTYVPSAGDAGHALRCVVVATNAGGSSTSVPSAPTTVLPAVPVNSTAPSIVGVARELETLSCASGTWTPTPTGTTARWLRNGTQIPGATASLYTVTTLDVGAALTCEVTASNAGGSGVPATSGGVVPTAIAPALLAPPSILGTAQAGRTVACEGGAWTGSPTSYTREWRRDGTPIPGATSIAYLVSAADVATNLTCRVTASNGGGSATADSTAVVPIAALLPVPVATTNPVVSGTATISGLLTCARGTWANSPTSDTVTWLRDGVIVEGQSDAVLALGESDAGRSIGCLVTATNSAGSGIALSATVVIAGAPPTALSAPTVVGSVRVGQRIWCDAPTWSPLPQAVTFEWLVDGAPVAGQTASRYTVATRDAGDTVACRVSGTNAGGTTRVVSASHRVSVAAPLTLRIVPPSGRDTPTSNIRRLAVRRGTWVQLAGTVRTDAGVRADEAPVVLRMRRANGSIRVMGSTLTNASGNFRIRFRATEAASLYVNVPAYGDSPITGDPSNLVTILMRR